jgi:hypothetical protein
MYVYMHYLFVWCPRSEITLVSIVVYHGFLVTVPEGPIHYPVKNQYIPIGSMVLLYMVTFSINISPMLAYIPYRDPMGYQKPYGFWKSRASFSQIFLYFHNIFSYAGWKKSCTTYITLDVLMHNLYPRTPKLNVEWHVDRWCRISVTHANPFWSLCLQTTLN